MVSGLKMEEVTGVTYKDFLGFVDSFISLDISVDSTGWVKWKNGVLEEGVYEIKAGPSDDVGRRREFRQFVTDLFGSDTYDYLFVEDTIGGVNYKTNKILNQLNAIPADLADQGIIQAKSIIYEGNGVWKKNLKKASGVHSRIVGSTDDKKNVRMCLHHLGYGDGTTRTIKQDIYDAMGMAVGIIYKLFLVKKSTRKTALKKDITKVYRVLQFSDEFDALEKADSIGRKVHNVDLLKERRDLEYNFKKLITELGTDEDVYVIKVLTSKIGELALNKGFDLDLEVSYLVVYRNIRKKKS